MTRINEYISVGVVFKGGQVIPKWLLWRNRRVEIERVALIYDGKEGYQPLLTYSLVSATAIYGVVWNRESNIWKIIEVSTA